MSESPFWSARLKLDRADHHIRDLQIARHRLFQDDPHTVTVSVDPESGSKSVYTHFTKQAPVEFSLIIGDAVHNLRSALDHAMWKLIELDGGKPKDSLIFPTSKGTAQDYKATCEGIKTQGFREDTIQFIIDLECYIGGKGQWLYVLHFLNITDKHRFIVTSGRAVSVEQGDEPKATVDIFFGCIDFVDFYPVIETLFRIRQNVTDCISRLETFVANRNI